MKLPHPKVKISFSILTKLVLVAIILFEIYVGYLALYKNLQPQASTIVATKIVKVDLKAYEQTAKLLDSLKEFSPNKILENSNPFQYH